MFTVAGVGTEEPISNLSGAALQLQPKLAGSEFY